MGEGGIRARVVGVALGSELEEFFTDHFSLKKEIIAIWEWLKKGQGHGLRNRIVRHQLAP